MSSRSFIDTTSSRPSGSQPSPDGLFGTSTTVSVRPSSPQRSTRLACMSEEPELPVVPARAFGEAQTVDQDLGVSRHRRMLRS